MSNVTRKLDFSEPLPPFLYLNNCGNEENSENDTRYKVNQSVSSVWPPQNEQSRIDKSLSKRVKKEDSDSDFSPVSYRPLSTAEKKKEVLWTKKSPAIVLQDFTLNGKEYRLNLVHTGSRFRVYACDSEQPIIINTKKIPAQSIVVKLLHYGNVGSHSEIICINNAHNGYNHLKAIGAPVPRMYTNPIDFEDEINERNGKFWIIEKIEHKVTGDGWKHGAFDGLREADQDILIWAKSWLTKMAIEEKDLIPNFRKQNTMTNNQGSPFIVDFLPPSPFATFILSDYVKDWSNGNRNIINFLISDFPEKIQESIK